MKYFEDVAYVVLIALLVPFLIAFGWIAVGVILIRKMVWWMRGTSTPRPVTAYTPD